MIELKLKKVAPDDRLYPDLPEYTVWADGERVGVVRRTTTTAGYWGAWEGRCYGRRIWEDSRKAVLRKIEIVLQARSEQATPQLDVTRTAR